MKTIYLLIISSLLFVQAVYSQGYKGDFTIKKVNAYGIVVDAEVFIYSMPFEGKTDTSYMGQHGYRIDSLFNGSNFRRLNLGYKLADVQLYYYHETSSIQADQTLIDLGHCKDNEINEDIGGGWGFAKYGVKINTSNEQYFFIFNCLDSKYGKTNWGIYNRYGMDWFFIYDAGLPVGNRMIICAAGSWIIPDTLSTSEYGKEYKVWELMYNRQNPFATDFYARATPFPVSKLVAENYVREIRVGTKVVFDRVYREMGSQDKYGYNTQNDPYFLDPPVPAGYNDTGNTYVTPATFFISDTLIVGIKIIAEAGDIMIIKNNKKVWISGLYSPNVLGEGDTLLLKPGSTLIKEEYAKLNACFGGTIIDEGANKTWANSSCSRIFNKSNIVFKGENNIVNNGGYIEIDSNATLQLGDNSTLTFDNTGTYLKLKPGAQVILGNNAMIKFTNGAYLDANGATFNNPNGYWQGIVFENAGSNTNIRNCTFNKAIVALNFYNTGTASLNNTIYNNTFNVQNPNPNDHYKGIYARNVYSVTFDQNTFNLSSGAIGVIIQNAFNPPEPGGGDSPSEIDFTNNYFTGGYLQLFIGGYASANIPVYVYNNTFTNGGWCFAGRMVTGSIKQNNITRNVYNYAFGLWQSNPNMINNTIINQNGSGVYFSAAFPVLAPTVNQNNFYVWYAGNNRINVYNGDVINMLASKPVIDQGYNYFSINNSANYHIYGSISTAEAGYLARYNCWYGSSTPRFCVFNNAVEPAPVTVVYSPIAPNCEGQINYSSTIINDLGNEIYDTIGVSENNSEITAPMDEIIYSQAVSYKNGGSYFDAITNYKNLIDNYPTSSYLYTSLYDLYTCYEGLDTADQTHRDLIFGDLKFYLENKIQQYSENDEFVSIAYNLILMCETMLENYNDAMTGYEFISLYHPDPEQRMWASMDYGEIQNLLNGMGGGEPSNLKLTKKSNILKRMDKKPYTRIVKDIFTKGSRELDKKLNDKNLREDRQTIQKKELIERAKQNINVSRSLTKQQREERRMEDINILIKQSDNVSTEKTINVPARYSLHQNYPNPFNPSTTIKYELPNDAMITFKIYDILGKEIYSINEFRKAGIFSITFDGSKYASGIYFYRMESGSYTETKKMVLVK